MFVKSGAVLGAAFLTVLGTGCATKKHVRSVVAPVEARVTGAEQKGRQQEAQIGELQNNVSRADEHAMDADRKARAAGDAAERANQSAQTAGLRADEARKLAEGTRSRIGEVVENFDNYKPVSTETVLFNLNKSNLTKQAMEQLDHSVAGLQSAKNYLLEIQGYADKSGNAQSNLALSQRRADSVVRYLTTKHNIPLRKIHVLGLGEEGQENANTREARKQARKVEIRVFALDLGADKAQSNTPAVQSATERTTASAQ